MTLAPGSTIGIVGGGQLGRMLAMAAAQLGYKCHIYAPEEAPPAAEVAAGFTAYAATKLLTRNLVLAPEAKGLFPRDYAHGSLGGGSARSSVP